MRDESAFPLDEVDRVALATFMSAQLTRGRVIRENLTRSISELNSMMLKVAAANYTDAHWIDAIGHVPSADELDAILHNEQHFEIQPTNAMLLETLLGSVAEVAENLAKRTWTLARFETPCLFAAENPVVHINPHGEIYGYGVATAERMYMPVSTSHALVLSNPWTSWPEAVVDGKEDLVS
jgi:hypothetical protein